MSTQHNPPNSAIILRTAIDTLPADLQPLVQAGLSVAIRQPISGGDLRVDVFFPDAEDEMLCIIVSIPGNWTVPLAESLMDCYDKITDAMVTKAHMDEARRLGRLN